MGKGGQTIPGENILYQVSASARTEESERKEQISREGNNHAGKNGSGEQQTTSFEVHLTGKKKEGGRALVERSP